MFGRMLPVQKMMQALILVAALLTPCPCRAAAPATKPADEATRQRAIQMLQSGPAVFQENKGQWADEPVRYVLNGTGVNVGLTSQALRFQLRRREGAPGEQAQKSSAPRPGMRPEPRNEKIGFTQFKATFEGSNAGGPAGLAKSAQVFHYRVGEPSRWRENVPAWESIVYKNLYDGIDLVLKGTKSGLKYEFHLAPGADARKIRLHYEGISKLSIDDAGTLSIHPAEGWAPLTDGAPVLWQGDGDQRKNVAGHFKLIDAQTVGFEITGQVDPAKPLVIDPVLGWSQYLGSGGTEECNSIAGDGFGIYIAGSTTTDGWISGTADFNNYNGGLHDAFVYKITSGGDVIWGAIMGGGDDDIALCCAAEATSGVYVGGTTGSSDEWISGGMDNTYGGGSYDGFVMHLDKDGSHLWSTYVGGADHEEVRCLAISNFSDLLMVGGYAESSEWAWNGNAYNGGASDGFLMAMELSSATSHWTRFIGGGSDDSIEDVVMDNTANIYVTGTTHSSGWITGGGWKTTYGGGANDGFAAKFDLMGARQWATYLGGAGDDKGWGIALDSWGNSIVVGETSQGGWGVMGGGDLTHNGGKDGYVVKLNTTGGHMWSTYLGGTGDDVATKVVIGKSNNIYVAGTTSSDGWFMGSWDNSLNGGSDAFLFKMSDLGTFLWNGCIGGSGNEVVHGLLRPQGWADFLLAGTTNAGGWATKGFYAGSTDTFTAKVSDYGALRVSFLPPAAVTQGAQWRLFPSGTWRLSGELENGLPENNYTVECTDTTDWLAPGMQWVYVSDGDITSVTYTYTRKTGNLTITIDPPEAVDAGGMWRRVGTTTWHPSGFTELNLPTGGYDIEFTNAFPYLKPSTMNVFVQYGMPNSYTAFYVEGGYLKTTIQPPAAAAAGCQWRRVGTIPWLNSDAVESGIVPGSYQVEFRAVTGWNAPGAVDVTVAAATQTDATGWFTRQYGTLTVNIGPAGAVTNGAQWRRVAGDGTWRAAGSTETNVPVGTESVEFKTVTDWDPPTANMPAVINNNSNTVLNATYTHQTGSIIGTILPAGAVTDGGRWRRTGTTTWYASGQTETGVLTGTYDVEFLNLANWDEPLNQPVTVLNKTAAPVSGTYVRHMGALQVNISPPEVLPLGAQWRRLNGDGTWYNSGDTENNVPTGSYYIEYKPVAGYAGGSTQQAVISRGQTTVVNGTYYPVGSLQVTLQPPEAVAAGAKWRRVGTTTWFDSGATEANVASIDQEIEFQDATGYAKPANITVTVQAGLTATGTATYTRETGGLRVTLLPPGAAAAGGQWKRVGTSTWLNSGATETGIPTGTYDVEFLNLSGWTTPPNQPATVVANTVTNTSATYTAQQSLLLWSTYVGDTQMDLSYGVATDNGGACYIVGATDSDGWVSGAFDNTLNGDIDAFVLKLNGMGVPVWGTFLGGSLEDDGTCIAVDRSDNIIIGGQTASSTGGWITGTGDTTYNGGSYDGFIIKLSNDGIPQWGTYAGGNNTDFISRVTVDASNNIIACGGTRSSSGWMGGGWKNTYGGGTNDGFAAKFTPEGVMSWSTYLGGGSDDQAFGLALESGSIYVSGDTQSAGWVGGAFDSSYHGSSDTFLVKLNALGQHQWSTYLGGTNMESNMGLAPTGVGEVLVTGETASAGWLTGGDDTTLAGTSDGYLVKVNSVGMKVWGTYIGGTGADAGRDVALDNQGRIYVAGETRSAGWARGGFNTIYGGYGDAFLARFAPNGRLLWSTYMGADGMEWASGVAIDRWRNVYVTGETMVFAINWVSGGYDTTYGGVGDGFAARITNLAELEVDITPPEAMEAGAAWRRTSTTAWRDGGTTESALWPGDYTIEFKAIPGFITPANMNVTAVDGLLTVVTGAYIPKLGTLHGTITPAPAVTDGAQWRRVGSAIWQNSGASVPTVIGSYDIEFKDLPNWDKPANVHVNVIEGQTTNFSGDYQRHLGSLTVTILPPAAAATATWRIFGVSGWQTGGTTLNNIPTGNYQVEFASLAGWNAPALQPVTITKDQNTAISGTYVASGSLRVNIGPAQANTEGARWRRQGTGTWLASGTETGVPVGSYTIEFLDLAGWNTPSTINVNITQGSLTTRNANYVRQTGSLKVDLYPAAAVTDGGQWRRTGTATWQDSGVTEANVPTGNVMVEFKSLPKWLPPNPVAATVALGQLTQTSATYGSPGGNMTWSTYLGGDNIDRAWGVDADSMESIYVTGQTQSPGWLSSGSPQGNADIFVIKLSPDGQPIWSSYFGGANNDIGYDVAAGSGYGNIYVVGETASPLWINKGSLDLNHNGGKDGFIIALDPLAGSLQWGSYLGGSGDDVATGISRGTYIYVCGTTASPTWFSTPWGPGGWKTSYQGGATDGFVVAISNTQIMGPGSFLGSSGADTATKVYADYNSDVVVAGTTDGSGWVTGGYDTTRNGQDAYVAKFSATLYHLWSTYVGGDYDETGVSVACDQARNIYLVGQTSSPGWVSGGYNTTFGGYDEGYVAKLDPNNGQPLWSSYIGGNSYDYVTDVAADYNGSAYIVGHTFTPNLVSGGFNTTYIYDEGFMMRLSPTGQHLWSTFLGGGDTDNATAVALDYSHNILVAGYTLTYGWTVGGYDTSYNGFTDGFLAKMQNTGWLRVNIQPPQAITDGARWRVYGTSTWRNSGTSATLTAGMQTVEFRTIPGWNAPANTGVNVGNVEVTSITGTYSRQYGNLQIKIDPPEAVAAGAKWHLSTEPTVWRDSESSISGLPVGNYTVQFNTVPDWTTPGNLNVTVLNNLTTTATGTYIHHMGTLTVGVAPPEAAMDGAEWRRVGQWQWLDAGETEANVPTGTYDVEFSNLSDWLTPAPRTVTIVNGVNTWTTGTYQRMGSLCVNLDPPEAVAQGAQWRRAGTTNWFNSGDTETRVPVGTHALEFKMTADWTGPAGQTADVSRDQTTNITCTYVRGTGSLKVQIYPRTAASGGAQWRRVGTTPWLNSDDTETGILTGDCAIEFSTIPMWSPPANISAHVFNSQLTQTSATYSPQNGVLMWSSYAGGTAEDRINDVAVHWTEEIYVTGSTYSSSWISGGPDTIPNGDQDAFVMKLGYTGTPIWSTYLGGANADSGNGIALDGSANIYVAGKTASPGWISGASNYHGGSSDGFLVKLGPDGVTAWGNFLGDSGADQAFKVAYDYAGHVIVCGDTDSPSWTLPGGWVNTFQGSLDGFVIQFSDTGTQNWGSFIGQGGWESVRSVAVDGSGNPVVTGYTTSGGSWLTGAWDDVYSGGADAFVVKLDTSGQKVWGTFIGGNDLEIGEGIACDAQSNIFVTGRTVSAGWVSGGFDTTYGGATDAFLTKLTPAGQHLWSTYLGGDQNDYANDVCTDNLGNAYVTGQTDSAGWARNGWDTQYAWRDAFLAMVTPTGRLFYNTYLGGNDADEGLAVALRNERKPLVAGITLSDGWTKDGYDMSYGGNGDAFIARMMNMAELRVDIQPPGAVAAGAKWRRAGTPFWLDSGTTESALWPTNYTVEFSTVPGYTTPTSVTLFVSDSKLTTMTGTYDPYRGSLQVFARPDEVLVEGAYWRRVGTWRWFIAGSTESNLPVGDYTVEFSPIGDWDVPPPINMTVVKDAVTVSTGTYTRHVGTLTGNILPSGAVAAGAKWRRVGTTPWLNSGDTETSVPVGLAEIEFLHVPGWAEPNILSASVNRGMNTKFTGIYELANASLTVTIQPPEAVAAGAQWRRQGTTTWLNSGVTESNLLVGPATVEFSTIPGWSTPAAMDLDLAAATNTPVTATYVRYNGSLKITLVPTGAPLAGAKWRRKGTANWLDSGFTETNIPIGTYTVEFLAIPNWTEPTEKTVTITKDTLTAISYSYVQHTGLLKVNISPATAVSGGAMWRRKGTTTWFASGAQESGVPVGTVTVEFKALTYWNSPANVTGSIVRNTLTTLSGTYVHQLGSIRGVIMPIEAAQCGAQWRRVGTTTWLNNEAVETGFLTGSTQTVEFKPIPNWTTPGRATVTIQNNIDAYAWGNYTHETGILGVTITPAPANTAGAKWRRVGTTTWLSSGTTESAVNTGECEIEFKDLTSSYWSAPAKRKVTLVKGKWTSISVAYAAILKVTATAPMVQALWPSQTARLGVSAEGNPTMKYQWFKDGVALANEKSAGMAITSLQLKDEGNYVCRVGNSWTTVTSPAFQVLVHNGAGVIQYLLGMRSSQSGLDFNADRKVDIADALVAVQMTAPAVPSGPIPKDKASWVVPRPKLDWDDTAKATTYDLFFWTGTTTPTQPMVTGLTASEYQMPRSLSYYTGYKWRVVARRGDNTGISTAGPVWTFQTEKPVHILTPNGGQTLAKGSAVTVTWKVDTSVAGLDVRLELWRAGAKVALLKDRTSSGSGYASLSVVIPNTSAVQPGNNYRIRAISIAMEPSGSAKAWDESDSNLTIQ